MYALKMLGLIVLAGVCTVAFILGYGYYQKLSASQRAREEVSRLNDEIEYMISSGAVGENEELTLNIPEGYSLHFDSEAEQIAINGTRLPEEGYDMEVEFLNKDLESGPHKILIIVRSDELELKEVI